MTQQRAEYPLDYTKTSAEPRDGTVDMADALAQKVADATAGAQELAGKVADQAREYGDQAQEAVKNFKPYVEKSLKEQPMATLAVAAAIGVVLGALWKR
jgi:ElaB/YqjD/DUF883 family membrane-anchored ribosome-binding protein